MLLEKKIFVGMLLILIFSVPTFSYAEEEIGVQDSDINVETIPDNPEPYQDVTLNLTSYATDLNKAAIEWKSGTAVVLSGIGRASYSFKAPGPDISMLIQVTITPAGSIDKISKQISVSTSEIEVLWESVDGYTPPFYRGKSFATAESTIKVVAVPTTSVVKTGKGNITYTWKHSGDTAQGASGYNKDSFTFANSELNTSEDVSVSASSVDGRYNAAKTISIPIINPTLKFYERSPTEGILYNQMLDNPFVSADEMTVVAVPYFLPIKGNEDKFDYKWQINDEDIATPSRKTELTIHPSARGGYATIDLTLENLNAFFQKVSGSLRLNL